MMSLQLSFELFLDNKSYVESERFTEEDLRNELCIAVKKMTVRQVTVTEFTKVQIDTNSC